MSDGHGHAHSNLAPEVLDHSPHAGSSATGKVLTPEDVQRRVFATSRLREGYDLAEVDLFLGEVESSLRRLHQENGQLKTQLNPADQPRVDIPPTLGASGLHTETPILLISTAQEEAAAIRAQAEADARARTEALREGLRRAREILSRDLQEIDRRRVSLEDHLSQIDGLIDRLRQDDEASPGPGASES
ncbi:DivIVA domain-containing protein [Acrocarpospora catenulata]|uniref:DivIVA domain-containing protein n=1 Tax=Acrocarpospora catenulata TaxID=2836182 RepID=UPI001BD994FC|nr:DivIVA domain-containing protein [Acrocarpospora catenulata]